ncbi:hypothetical protein TNCV_3495351 [Trichonephila clavipes]|nr:hypothetical protein TNCV_3495351 [Trichonephila clavipes]
MAKKGEPHLLMTKEQKYYVSEVKEFYGHPSESDMNDDGVFVSSKTIRSRLADVRLKVEKSRTQLTAALKGTTVGNGTHQLGK